MLWERLCYEKRLMLRERSDVNERFLYHTSKSKVSVICEEGLDQRLSGMGLFGHGIYFRYIVSVLDCEYDCVHPRQECVSLVPRPPHVFQRTREKAGRPG